MKIKNILPVILLAVLTAGTSLAQEKQPLFYIKAYAGDAVLTPGSDGVRPGTVFGIENGSTGNYSYSKKGLGQVSITDLALKSRWAKYFR